mmetsp:Transcript_1759/g.2426  ORF Transcript_1759/g.2426 Transcript_1759/m.2426 type:complete len:124 (-) Transcript_1759:815-1186(-)
MISVKEHYLVHLFLALLWSATSTVALAASGSRTVLVTGGAGYIGSHTCLELLETDDYNVVVVDNLDNSSEESLKRVRELTNCDEDRLHFRQCDIRDKVGLKKGCWGVSRQTFGLLRLQHWRNS